LWIPDNKDLVLESISAKYHMRAFASEYDCYDQMVKDIEKLPFECNTKWCMRGFLMTLFSREIDQAYAIVSLLEGDTFYPIQARYELESRFYNSPMWKTSCRMVIWTLLQLSDRVIREKELSAIAYLYSICDTTVSKEEVWATLVMPSSQWASIPRTSH